MSSSILKRNRIFTFKHSMAAMSLSKKIRLLRLVKEGEAVKNNRRSIWNL